MKGYRLPKLEQMLTTAIAKEDNKRAEEIEKRIKQKMKKRGIYG